MADYDLISYEDDELFQEKNDNVTDLHAYYMSQFNLELENGKSKPKNPEPNLRYNIETKNDSFKFGVEESFDFEVLDGWNSTENNRTDFEMIDEVLDSNVNDQNIKEVLLDLDSIDFDDNSFKSDDSNRNNDCNYNNDYIDDESLIDELCREDGESRMTPETFSEDYLKTMPSENLLPSIETAFSKRYCNYNNTENYPNNVPSNVYDVNPNNTNQAVTNSQTISSLEHYSYPNNILYNIDNEKRYTLPDTPTSCTEFNFDRNSRTVSISDSIESDVHSRYYDETSENFDEDELFINLDDFGLVFERDNEGDNNSDSVGQKNGRNEKDKSPGERVCLWEQCLERYPNQNSLVEHIERAHVNTYKGDEFSCLWRECLRARRPFNARYKLLIHMRVHSGHKPNRCHHPGCGKAFSRLENLKIHVRSHTGERPYACPAPHCRKAFSNSSDRAKHQRTHFNARPYACGAIGCGKRYTDPSSLRKHVKSHPHVAQAPRPSLPPTRPIRRTEEQLVPSSPAKLTTLRCIRDKLTVPKLQKM